MRGSSQDKDMGRDRASTGVGGLDHLLRGLPLTSYEQHLLDKIEYQAHRLSAPWQQVAHLPFVLITAVMKDHGTGKKPVLPKFLKKESRK